MGTRYNVNAKTKPCPRCGIGKVYTGDMTTYNPTVDGVQVCTDCKTNELINNALNRRAD